VAAAPSTHGTFRDGAHQGGIPVTGRPTRKRAAASRPATGYAMHGLQGRVINAIGSQIVGGRFAPGDVLPTEAELTAEHHVSRTPVREAMRVLAAKGMVEFRRKLGTRVRPREQWNVFDADILRWHQEQGLGEGLLIDLVETRQLLEPAAARLAAARATMDDLGRLERAVVAMADRDRGLEGYATADVEFHLTVYAASHNLLLRQFGTVVADLLHLTFNLQQITASDDQVLVEDAGRHAAVFEAINRGNGEAAAEAMLDVVLDGKRALRRALSDATTPDRAGG
jgi:DNA-binding FadR family transcriptional regulator